MKVLMITGDKHIVTPGSEAQGRFELQRAQVEQLVAVYVGRGSMWPKLPEGAFDVVTSQDPLLRGAFAWRAANKIGARLNVQVHMDIDALSWWWRALAQIVLRRADSVRVVSEKIKTQVEAVAPRAKVSVLPVYVDISRFVGLQRRPHSRFKKTILWVGRFEPEKDPLLALSVLEAVHRQEPDVGLVMLGKGSLEPNIRARASKFSQSVELPGWQDPVSYLAQADVVLCTSMHESWGASIVEALAAGVAVVAPDVGVAKEAGARVVPRDHLADETLAALRQGERGVLKLRLLDKQEWAAAWKLTLI
jgi:glycosyltransferase involved in cell wall biosynthesis